MNELFLKKLEDKLDRILDLHKELMKHFPSDEGEFKEKNFQRMGIEKIIEVIAEYVIDICLIIISEKGLEKPNDNRDTIAVLEKYKHLTAPLSKKLQDLASFRNLLIHQYAKIDQKREYHNISENHEDIIHFVKEIEEFIKKEKNSGKKKVKRIA